MYPHHFEYSSFVPASADAVFAYADDQTRLSSHMSESSWKMGGGKMRIDVDRGRGQQVGSRIRLSGKVFGMEMSVEEVVTERMPPHRKAWDTVGKPKLLVVGHYRMGFDIRPQEHGVHLTVFIDYAMPESAPGRWLGHLFGAHYARWCTRQMAEDVAKHFQPQAYQTPA